jgi:hypothetical protein
MEFLNEQNVFKNTNRIALSKQAIILEFQKTFSLDFFASGFCIA